MRRNIEESRIMGKQRKISRVNTGTPFLILVFIVMCLVTFGVLSLSAAKSEWNLAKRNALAVTEYYRADGEGEVFYQKVLQKMEEAGEKRLGPQETRRFLIRELGSAYNPDEETAAVNIPMERSQALSIELMLNPGEEEEIRILKWKVIQMEDYEIDHSMQVWSGGETENQETER